MQQAQYPAKAGSIRAVIDLSSISNTDWNNLTSADFVDSTTGASCRSGLKFEWLGIYNAGSDSMYIKYRASSASDSTTNELLVVTWWDDDLGTLRTPISTVAYKKASASDVVIVFAGFSAT